MFPKIIIRCTLVIMKVDKDERYFYFDQIDAVAEYELEGPEVHHMTKVLRMKEGQSITLLNGKGNSFSAQILELRKGSALVSATHSIEPSDKKVNVTIGISPTKNMDRFEWFLEKATEIGVGHIVPLLCSRSQRKIIKPERCKKILVSAMKQSGRTWLPKLSPLTEYGSFIGNVIEQGYIAHCGTAEKTSLRKVLTDKEITVLIGPEGDFTEQEIDMAMRSNYKALDLGDNRLRTETAGILVCAALDLQRP